MSRRQETLKTIDQIHQEAEMEAIQEKEMIRSLQPVSGKQYQRVEKKRDKLEWRHPSKLVCMLNTLTSTCMNFLSRFRSIEYFDDHGL